MTQQHTTLPWAFDDSGMVSPNTELCITSPCEHGPKIIADMQQDIFRISDSEARANAEFIVLACNNHYDLMRIAHRAKAIVNYWHTVLRIEGHEHRLMEAYQGDIQFIEEVITKVEGK